MWQGGIKVEDGINIANQLTWKYRRVSWVIQVIQSNQKGPLNVEEGSRRVRSQCHSDATWERLNWPLLALKIEWGHVSWSVGSLYKLEKEIKQILS